MNSLLCLTVCLAACGVGNSPAPRGTHEAPKRNFTAARLSEVDEDFSYQGEYVGLIGSPETSVATVGLQVTALGDGQFSAVSFASGLPGNGADLSSRQTWQGRRRGTRLLLHHQQETLQVERSVAVWQDAQNKERGKLGKVLRISKTLGATPPLGATVLFHGHDVSQLKNAKLTSEGWLLAGAITRMAVHDFQLHVEFRTPYKPAARDQGRGNSGIYIQQRYEVQVLDSFGLPTVFNGGGALYHQRPERLNMCLPPLTWQTYDIYFRAARWDACGRKSAPARITVLHNGVQVHSNQVLPTKTGAGKPEAANDLPILFQNHGNPVQYRNLWMVNLADPRSGVNRPRVARN